MITLVKELGLNQMLSKVKSELLMTTAHVTQIYCQLV